MELSKTAAELELTRTKESPEGLGAGRAESRQHSVPFLRMKKINLNRRRRCAGAALAVARRPAGIVRSGMFCLLFKK